MSTPNSPNPPQREIQRQIALPMSKAVEIAYKNIRMRLSRSLLVTSGIVLALAFLMSIRTQEAIVTGMRDWVTAAKKAESVYSLKTKAGKAEEDAAVVATELKSAAGAAAATMPTSRPAVDAVKEFGAPLEDLGKRYGGLPAEPQLLAGAMQADERVVRQMKVWIKLQEDRAGALAQYEEQKKQLTGLQQQAMAEIAQFDDRLTALKAEIKPLTVALSTAKPSGKKETFSARREFGEEFNDLYKELKTLPGTADSLTKALTGNPELIGKMREWIKLKRQQLEVEGEAARGRKLESTMKDNGVSTDPAEVENAKTQTRWMLGLALLVAFVGILNAMLMSVTERFREIGTMKCLGALDSFIVKLFLIESLFQGIVGTVLGMLIGMALTLLAHTTTYGLHYTFANLPWMSVLSGAALVFIVGTALTVAGAVYPAWQAARMHPIEAMRVET